MLDQAQATGNVRNEVPETGLFVTVDGVGDIPEQVAVNVVERSLVQLTALGGDVDAVPAEAGAD